MIIDFQNDSSFFFRLIYKHWEPVISPGDLHLGYGRAYNVVWMLPVSFNRHVLLSYRGCVSFIKSDGDIDENFLSTHFE